MPAEVLDHSILGHLKGLVSAEGQTIQYRNLKYAQVPGRWQDPFLFSQKLGTETSPFDATKLGPSCPQHPVGFQYDLSLIGDAELEMEKEAKLMDEFECLNLVVTAPKKTDSQFGGPLPVFVWVHGGGFSVGSNSWPQYDLSNIVRISVEIGKPIVAVSINYRLGPFGFLASDELGITGNYALKDQICAFEWVQKHIAGFGGNPTNVTAGGESAGSICLSTLLCTNPSMPLFNRAIFMSGDATLRRPRDMKWQNTHYQSLFSNILATQPTQEAKKVHIRKMTAEVLVANIPAFSHWSPTIDGKFLPEEITLGILSDPNDNRGKPNWCNEILVGDTAHDGSCMKGRLLDDPNAMQRLHSAMNTTFSPSEQEIVLAAYGLADSPDPHKMYNGLLDLASDLRFHLPVLKVTEGWKKKKRFRYHFHQRNPILGTWHSYASHELDVAYLLGNFDLYFPKASKKLGKDMVTIWIRFIYGYGFGRSSSGDIGEQVLIIGPNEDYNFVKQGNYDEIYRNGRVKLWDKIGWERWFKLGELLQGC